MLEEAPMYRKSTPYKREAKRFYQILFMLQFTSFGLTFAVTNSVWISIYFTDTAWEHVTSCQGQAPLASWPRASHWCWDMKMHLLITSMCNLEMQTIDAMWGKPVKTGEGSWDTNSPLFYSEWTSLSSCHLWRSPCQKERAISQSIWMLKDDQLRTSLCIFRKNIVGIFKYQKMIVRLIEYDKSFIFQTSWRMVLLICLFIKISLIKIGRWQRE